MATACGIVFRASRQPPSAAFFASAAVLMTFLGSPIMRGHLSGCWGRSCPSAALQLTHSVYSGPILGQSWAYPGPILGLSWAYPRVQARKACTHCGGERDQ